MRFAWFPQIPRPLHLAAALLLAVLPLASCSRSEPRREVVLYSSVDDALLREVVRAFERQSGITVKIVGDTEATKTTGLVERLIAEKGRPRADVWWSSEPFGAIHLAGEGVLEPYRSRIEEEIPGGWPAAFRAPDAAWYAFASRARVIVYSTRRLTADQAPRTLAALAEPGFRVGIARPQFGTTRGHMGALLAEYGEGPFKAWLEALKAGGVRLYDGNAAVVRAVAYGEIDAGLTDTDDVYAGQREGWPVALVPASAGLASRPEAEGPMLVPNTVAKVRGGPHPREAEILIDFLLSEPAERLLAESESRNMPVRPTLAAELADPAVPGGWLPDLGRAAAAIPPALRLCDQLLR